MAKCYFAPWDTAVDSSIDDDGVRNLGIATIMVTVYEPGDAVPRYALPVGELIEKYMDPSTGLITQGLHHPPMTMDAAVLRGLPPTAMASLGVRFAYLTPGAHCPIPDAK